MKKLYFGVFLALMVIGGVSIFATKEKTFSENENRYLNTFADMKSTDDVEKTLADQFPLRDAWLTVSSKIRYLTGAREINSTYIGKDGYLFNACAEEDFQTKRYSMNLEFINDFAKKSDIDVTVALVPSPYTIMADRLPKNAPTYDAQDKYELAEALLTASNVESVDLRASLADFYAEGTQTYYKTDHHWTTWGAAAAYNELRMHMGKTDSVVWNYKQVSDNFHGTLYSRVLINNGVFDSIVAIDPEEKLNQVSGEQLYVEEKLETKDQYAYFLGGNDPRLDIKGIGEGNVLVIKDSYANCVVPMLATDYANVTVLDLRYLNEDMEELLEEGVDGQKYDRILVLYEMTSFAENDYIVKLAK